MQFVISRASDSRGIKQPCVGARLTIVEKRTKKYEVLDQTERTVAIETIEQRPEWVISISSIEELVALSQELEHPLIVDTSGITIYDDFIE